MTALYYVLLFVSALIFSSQFLVTRQYQRRSGTGFLSSVRLSLGAYLTIALFFFIKGCISAKALVFGFSPFTFLMTLLIAVVSLSCVYMGIKVLAVGDMGIYSVFMMLGSLILPSLVGLIFYHESFGWIKAVALVLMLAAIVLSVSGMDRSKFTRKALLYYLGIFVMNGLIGVFFTVHQNNPALTAAATLTDNGAYAVNSDVFMTWYGLSTVLLCLGVYAVALISRRVKRAPAESTTESVPAETAAELPALPAAESAPKEGNAPMTGKGRLLVFLLLPALYGLCNGLGDYFIALATQPGALGSSVTFPIINGGTILFSTLCGLLFYREKLRLTTVLCLALVIASTVLFMFA